MSQKYKAYIEAQKRDMQPCAACAHPRIWHIGDGPCSAGTVRDCACIKFVDASRRA